MDQLSELDPNDNICNWATKLGCAPKCGDNMIYKGCADTCRDITTCSTQDKNKDDICTKKTEYVGMCVCKTGYIFEKGLLLYIFSPISLEKIGIKDIYHQNLGIFYIRFHRVAEPCIYFDFQILSY